MKPAIQNIKSIDLHDSCIEIIEKKENQMMIVLDWTIMENCNEKGGFDPLIQDHTTITLNGISEETIVSFHRGEKLNIDYPLDKIPLFKIKIHKYHINDIKKSIQIKGTFFLNKQEYTTCWKFKYDNYKIGCDSYFKFTDWANGKIPKHHKMLTGILLDTQ